MEKIIKIWIIFGLFVYWIAWIESMAIWNVSAWAGIGIGLIAFIIWFIILNILSKINDNTWVWEW